MSRENYAQLVQLNLNSATTKKDLVEKAFGAKMVAHFRLMAEITGMTVPGKYPGTRAVVLNRRDFGKSIAEDDGFENIRRLCFVLYYSCNAGFKKGTGCDMASYYEKVIMKEQRVVYGEGEPGRGCVAKSLNRDINKYRCNLRDFMLIRNDCIVGNVLANIPKKKVYPDIVAPSVKDSHLGFWVGRKIIPLDAQEALTNKERKDQRLAWTHVSE